MLKRILITALAAVMCFSAFGCGKDSGQNAVPVNEIKYTDYDLVSDGQSAYRVVVSEDSVYNERYARDEIVDFFFESTGVTLGKTTDAETEYSDDAKLIIVGETAFTDRAGIDTELEDQSFTLKTVGSNLFIYGGDDVGTLYGAYEFLHQNLGWEIYAADEIAIDRNVKNRKLIDFDFTDSPDIRWRAPNYGPLNDAIVANRFRLNRSVWMSQNGNFVHNTFSEYLPESKYGDHADWYGDNAEQLCYSAHGNAEELKLMQDAVVKRMQELVTYFYDQGKYLESISFTHEDNSDWCTCDACKAEKEKYGVDSAVLIHFINPVAERMKAWMEETYPGHELTIAIFAYVKTEEAPVRKVGNEYVAIDDTVYLNDNVAIFYAPYYANYYYDFYSDKNAAYLDTLKKWNVLSKHLYLWTYSTNFLDYLGWYDSFNSMQSIYRMARDMGATYLFDQGHYNTNSLTAFDNLKAYLNSKLAWNVDADVQAMTDAFFANYFKDAAEPMRKYFDSFRSWSEYLRQNYENFSGLVNTYIFNAEHWPKQVLVQWGNYIDEAYEAIEPLKTSDPQLYSTLYDRVTAESIAIRYHMIEFHGNTFEAEELDLMRRQFKADADRLGFTNLTEGGSLNDMVYSKWGLI